MPRAVVLMGSNSDAERHLQAALKELEAVDYLELESISEAIETPAIDEHGRADATVARYRNMAALVSTNLAPEELRTCLHAIEKAIGRDRTSCSTASVVIDLDVAVFENSVCSQGGLTIPDPAISRHAYAAVPVAGVVPHWIHPTLGMTYSEIASELINETYNTRRVQ